MIISYRKGGQGRKKFKEFQKERIRVQKEIIQNAKKCVKMPEFKRYKEDLFIYKEQVSKMIWELTEMDPTKFAFEIRGLLFEMKTLERLLHGVEKDAERQIEEPMTAEEQVSQLIGVVKNGGKQAENEAEEY